jgi:hypothetical protein
MSRLQLAFMVVLSFMMLDLISQTIVFDLFGNIALNQWTRIASTLSEASP